MRLLSVGLCGLLFLSVRATFALGDEPIAALTPAAASPAPLAPPTLGADAWAEIIRSVVIAAIPEKSVHDKNWGDTTKVFSRYQIKTKGGRISMRPLTNQVNHGLWQRQTVTMLKPEETLLIEFQNVQRLPDGKLTFTMQLVLRARVDLQFEHWAYGVKGINGQGDAAVTIAALTNCSLDLKTVQEKGQLLPSVQLVPEVTGLQLHVLDIDARKIGLIGGWAAEEMGDSSRSTVNMILNQFENSILKDLRRKVDKQKDRLKIAPSKLLGG